jgi:hypothetical protein
MTQPVTSAPVERGFADLLLVSCLAPGTSCLQSGLLMARLTARGTFELLSPAAWARALGYLPGELGGKYLRELMPLGAHAAGEVLADLLDPYADAPLDVPLRCKDERRKRFRFYRRFDERAETIFLVADELD